MTSVAETSSALQSDRCRNHQRIRLSRSVFSHPVRDLTFVRDVSSSRDFLFDGIAFEILSRLRNPVSEAELVEVIAKDHPGADRARLESSIRDFLAVLENERLVDRIGAAEWAADPSVSIGDSVRAICMEDHRLWSACLELTYRCNERCVHCYLDEPGKSRADEELRLAAWKRVIDECRDLGCANFLVTGGEPTLHPDFTEICKYIASEGMLLDIYTNGLHVSDAVFEAICDLPVNSVSVSLYGLAAFHDSITQVPGSFEKTLSTAMKFKCAGKDVYVKAVVFRDHLDDFKALHHLGRRLGMTVTPASVLVPGRTGESKDAILLTDKDYEGLLAFQAGNAASHAPDPGASETGTMPGRNPDGPICSAGQAQLSFSPTGIAFPCTALPIPVGDAKRQTVRDIWENSPQLKKIQRLRFRDLSPKCQTCPHSGECSVCLGSAWPKNASLPTPPEWACRQAAIKSGLSAHPFPVRVCEH